jgi:hypothetical protein
MNRAGKLSLLFIFSVLAVFLASGKTRFSDTCREGPYILWLSPA